MKANFSFVNANLAVSYVIIILCCECNCGRGRLSTLQRRFWNLIYNLLKLL